MNKASHDGYQVATKGGSATCGKATRLGQRAGLAACLLLMIAGAAWAAPFDRNFTYALPDGGSITLHGRGDDFSAIFETLDGYTVVFDQASSLYHYAIRGEDGRLASSGLVAGKGDPAAAGIARHVRPDAAVAAADRKARAQRWEADTGIRQRWNALKAQRLSSLAEPGGSGIAMAPPTTTTVGNKVGLTMLVDFSDEVGTIPSSDVQLFLNSDNYNGFGNNGSVKKYFQDNSAGKLTYTNVVVGYIRVPNAKTFYDSPTGDPRQLVLDAIAAMKALPNFATQILPQLQTLTADSSNRVVACNIYYAGTCASPWAQGLWPHSWNLPSPVDLWPGGKKVYNYQMTDMQNELSIDTFCHENGHMLCGFPDIYDYDYDSTGGAGMFCLMDYGATGKNPVQVCAYLKLAAGWATSVKDIPAYTQLFTLPATGPAGNVFLRLVNPLASTEYFLIENRQKTGRDAILPASGLAIWHVDELGDKDDQRILPNTSHENYEVSLEQADNLFHFQTDANPGDAEDLFYLGNPAAGYTNAFDDTTGPSAKWWSGAVSKLHVSNISASGNTMTLSAYAGDTPVPPTVQFASAGYSVLRNGGSATITVSRTGDPNKVFSVDYLTADDTAVAGTDYTATTGTLNFGAGETTKTFTVAVANPPHTPGDVTVNLYLTNPTSGATVGTTSTAVLTILELTPIFQFSAPAYNVNRATGSATVTILRKGNPGVQASVNYATANGTATAGTDYTAAAGTATFTPNQPSATIAIPLNNAMYLPGSKTFTITLSNPTNGAFLGSTTTAQTTIVSSQSPPTLSIAGTDIDEGDVGQIDAGFTVSLSIRSSLPVTVDYYTIDKTAKAGQDYTPVQGTLTIPPGQPSGTIQVAVLGETYFETDEVLLVQLANPTGATIATSQAQGRLRNDDPLPQLTVENAAGAAPWITFKVQLSQPSVHPISVRYQTVDDSAIAGRNYVMSKGIVAISPGETAATFTIPVLSNALYMEDKKFQVMFSGVNGATLPSTSAVGTVQSSIARPQISIEPGLDMGPFMSFHVRLSYCSEVPVQMRYVTANGTAAAGTHYQAVDSILVLQPGQAATDIIVPLLRHDADSRTVVLKAYDVTNADLAANEAAGVIQPQTSQQTTTPDPTTPILPIAGNCGAGASGAALLCCMWLAAMKWTVIPAGNRRRRG